MEKQVISGQVHGNGGKQDIIGRQATKLVVKSPPGDDKTVRLSMVLFIYFLLNYNCIVLDTKVTSRTAQQNVTPSVDKKKSETNASHSSNQLIVV